MVYESDFYTTRRPYRTTPTYSTYTVSSAPSRQVRILPGLGKVHIVHSYDRIVPYVGHKQLTVVTRPPKIFATNPAILHKEYDWIENRVRPRVGYSPLNRYLNSDSSVRIVYVRNPITTKYYPYERLVVVPSSTAKFSNNFRIIRNQLPNPYDLFWPYKNSLLDYPTDGYWPTYRTINSTIDDIPSYKSLRLQRRVNEILTGSEYQYRKWYNYSRYYKSLYDWYDLNPLATSRFWFTPKYPYYYNRYPRYSYQYYYPSSYRIPGTTPTPSSVLLPYQSFRYWYPKKSYYWYKYLPIGLTPSSSHYIDLYRSIFDDETRLIRAQTASLLKHVHLPLPRVRVVPLSAINRYEDLISLPPAKYSNDTYVHKVFHFNPKTTKVDYTTYYSEPVKKYIGGLSCVSYIGDKHHNRRQPLTWYEDTVKNDIQLLSYYINKFRQDKVHQPKEIKEKIVEGIQEPEISATSTTAE